MKVWNNGPLMADEPGAGGGNTDLTELTRQVARLQSDLKGERERRAAVEKAANEKERVSLIHQEVQRHGITGGLAEDAIRFFKDEIAREEDGSYRSKDGTELRDFVARIVAGPKKHWKSDRSSGRSASGHAADVDINDIKPGMSKAQKEAIYARIAELTSGLHKSLYS
ncbi:MAG: hypothetical protein FJW32_20755 [Acidobacteria bacterium]|nr:hypothetical protein [Acidobacteriota bacterium]